MEKIYLKYLQKQIDDMVKEVESVNSELASTRKMTRTFK